VWASVGAFHVCLWTFTMTEAWAWGRPAAELVDRSGLAVGLAAASPEPPRQAAGLASCDARARRSVRFYAPGSLRRKFMAVADRLLSLAA